MRCAVIAIGSNSCRLLIAQVADRNVAVESARPITVEHHAIRGTRLGEGVGASRELALQAMERTAAAIAEFAGLASRADRRFVIGTAALREAMNAAEFAERVHAITGTDLHILTGEEEARASFDGACWAFEQTGHAPRGPLTVVDIGGGSTEIATRKHSDGDVTVTSLPLGAVRLTERFFKHDPPTAEEIGACRTAIRLELDASENVGPERSAGAGASEARAQLVFVGGTADTAARMLNAYDPAATVHVATLRLADLEDLLRLMASLPVGQRKRLHELPEFRADIMPAGLIILDEIARRYESAQPMVSEADLLIGYLREKINMG
jgi:exopolyphosphatase / guanosine-5'-triphosphate,3'-diphosphate pyrophosphatase